MIEKDMGTLTFTLLIIGAVFTLIGVVTTIIGVLLEDDTCNKIGLYSFVISINCIVGAVITSGFGDNLPSSFAVVSPKKYAT